MPHRRIVFIYGPTASGKTDLASSLAEQMPAEIVNMDSAQLYTPLTIGTAKSDWRSSSYAQHMFDYIDEPKTITVHAYREAALDLIKDIWSRGNIPIFVGGSGFYLKSLLFPPQAPALKEEKESTDYESIDLWEKLNAIDPERAASIHSSDLYRIERALAIWHITGTKPSTYKPTYSPPAPFILIHVTRDRKDLYERINKRVDHMMDQGLLDEVISLIDSPWEHFVQEKRFIGYSELIEYLKKRSTLEEAVELIKQRTRNYAKRQETFWRMIKRLIVDADRQNGHIPMGVIQELDLTNPDLNLYIKQLLDNILLVG